MKATGSVFIPYSGRTEIATILSSISDLGVHFSFHPLSWKNLDGNCDTADSLGLLHPNLGESPLQPRRDGLIEMYDDVSLLILEEP